MLAIQSPFRGCPDAFDNKESSPDVTLSLAGKRDVSLHRRFLSEASNMFHDLFQGEDFSFCRYTRRRKLVEWFPEVIVDDNHSNVLMKWLQLCYGIPQSFNTDECPAALAVLFQLRLTGLDDMKKKIEQYMIKKAKEDINTCMKMLTECATVFKECHDGTNTQIDKQLASILFTSGNFIGEHAIAVDNCLMNLPFSYLNCAEYGPAHSDTSEFRTRLRYIKYHANSMSEDEKIEALGPCMAMELNPHELVFLGGRILSENHAQPELPSAQNKSTFKSIVLFFVLALAAITLGATTLWINKSNQVISNIVDLNDSRVLFSLGWSYYHGHGVVQDKKKGVELFELSSKLGNADAMFNLGLCYKNGEGVQENHKKMIELWQHASELGNSDALYNLGLCYKNGEELELNSKKASALFKQSSDMGNADAMNQLGSCYYFGEGIGKDEKKALELWNGACELGNTDAKDNLLAYETNRIQKQTGKMKIFGPERLNRSIKMGVAFFPFWFFLAGVVFSLDRKFVNHGYQPSPSSVKYHILDVIFVATCGSLSNFSLYFLFGSELWCFCVTFFVFMDFLLFASFVFHDMYRYYHKFRTHFLWNCLFFFVSLIKSVFWSFVLGLFLRALIIILGCGCMFSDFFHVNVNNKIKELSTFVVVVLL